MTADIGMIGCGQYAFSTVAHFLKRKYGARVAACYDIDPQASHTFGRAYGVRRVCSTAEELFETPGLNFVYVCSNHASHATYAARALERGLRVYIEKPIAVTLEQLIDLLRARRLYSGSLFAGYNRPFAPAIRELRARTSTDPKAGISLQCFVSGHVLASDHWYRSPEEGTRICGNAGHWLDLLVHILSWRGLPNELHIAVAYADPREPDDNIVVSITSDRGDLFSLMLTSRSEPFEGVSETINFQHGDTICKIDDFRSITIWQGRRLTRRRYWPKDVGHRTSVLQPFAVNADRDWREVEMSTLLMLRIADMVRAGERESTLSFNENWTLLQESINSQ